MYQNKKNIDTSTVYVIIPLNTYNQLKNEVNKMTNKEESLSDQMDNISNNPALSDNSKVEMYNKVIKNFQLLPKFEKPLVTEVSENKSDDDENSRYLDVTEPDSNDKFQKKVEKLWNNDIQPDKITEPISKSDEKTSNSDKNVKKKRKKNKKINKNKVSKINEAVTARPSRSSKSKAIEELRKNWIS